MMENLVSVIMSTYNETREELQKSIESILRQTYKNIEFIIVVDNPQNESIKKIVNNYKNLDFRIKVINNNVNLGLAASLNKAVNLAKGEFIARMDADDISSIDRIEKQIEFINDNNLDMVASNRIDIDIRGNVLSYKSKLPTQNNIKRLLPIGNFITHPTVIVKTSIIKNLSGYRNFGSAQDYDLWLRILSSGYKIGIIDEPLVFYRVRENSISNSNKYKQYLIGKYQKELYYKRITTKKDDFSEQNLESFLKKNNYYDENIKQRFNIGYQTLDKGILALKNKKYIKGFRLILRSMFKHKEIVVYIKNTLMYKWCLNINSRF